MFITYPQIGHNRHDEQTAHGLFLCIFNKESGGELRCIVRHARMRQCGHWMMASVQIGQERITLSGDYGGDGLPIATHHGETDRLWDKLHPLPADLTQVFWKGEGGWNCAGSEAPSLRTWAKENLSILRQLRQDKG